MKFKVHLAGRLKYDFGQSIKGLKSGYIGRVFPLQLIRLSNYL